MAGVTLRMNMGIKVSLRRSLGLMNWIDPVARDEGTRGCKP